MPASTTEDRFAAPATQLAAFRVVVCAALLLSPEAHDGVVNAALDPALRVAPEGLGWFVAQVPITASVARVAYGVFLVSASLTLLGYFARVAAGVMALSAFYAMALAQLSGSVLHDMHLLWFAVVLAASPCSDAWSIDAWGEARAASSRAYGVPVWSARALFAVIYFFAGFWKLRESGLAWIFSDNLLNHMHWKWFEAGGWTPAWRVDRYPTLVRAGALGVVLFECGFPLLLLHRRTRLLAALGGLAFHLSAHALLRIPFTSLWMCYVALVDWPRGAVVARSFASVRSSAIVGLVLVAAGVLQGARGAMQAWPFGCYPTFQWIAPDVIPDLRIEAGLSDGSYVFVRNPRARGNDRWAMAWRVAGLYGDPARESAMRAYVATVLADTGQRLPGATVRVRLWRVFYLVRPESYGRPPVRSELIGEYVP